MAIFDSLRQNAFDVVTRIMGEKATWTPYGTSVTHEGEVLLREPTEKDMRSGVEFTPLTYICEYQAGYFPGLSESVRQGNWETINIDGTEYDVRTSDLLVDGKNYLSYLEKRQNP